MKQFDTTTGFVEVRYIPAMGYYGLFAAKDIPQDYFIGVHEERHFGLDTPISHPFAQIPTKMTIPPISTIAQILFDKKAAETYLIGQKVFYD